MLYGPTVAARTARRFRLVFADSYRRDVSSKRRALVADYVAAWMSGTIVADLRVGADTIIAVAVARAVNVEIAEEYFRLCPHYVAGTFAAAE
jgi:hypothetical protein